MKKSLHFGINDYPGTNMDLHGCVNDARDWQQELHKRGFSTKIMLNSQCTKFNMINAIESLITEAKKDDIIVITYSGHGTWVPDKNGDEADSRDEGLCPYDIRVGRVLLDDELNKILSKNKEANIVFISDSCHSGTVTRFFDESMNNNENCQRRFLDTSLFIEDDIFASVPKFKATLNETLNDNITFFSGCKDTEFSYDANFKGKPNGAFTYVALKALKKMSEESTYEDWYKEIRKTLPHTRYPQTPQFKKSKYEKIF